MPDPVVPPVVPPVEPVVKTPEEIAAEERAALVKENATLKIDVLRRDGKATPAQVAELKKMVDAGEDVTSAVKALALNAPMQFGERSRGQVLPDANKPPAIVSPVGDAIDKMNANRKGRT